MRRQHADFSPALLLVLSLWLLLSPQTAAAQMGDSTKPYIVFIMDVSGSMFSPTGSGPPSCGGADTRFDHAKCALRNIVNNYGDTVIALARFREQVVSPDCEEDCALAVQCADCDMVAGTCTNYCNPDTGTNCDASWGSADQLEVLVPLVDNNQNDILIWNDFNCGTCTNNLALQPELRPDWWGFTPLAGSLKGAKRYLQGLNSPSEGPYWTGAGDDPIRDDPLNDQFLSPGVQCRPYIVILLTDGEETCARFTTETLPAATALLTTNVDGLDYRVETKPIGFGMSAPDGGACNGSDDGQIEDIAHAGGATDVAGQCEGYYAADEASLSLALSQIIADSLRFETCNYADDDCDGLEDEDFPLRDTACDDGQLGVCLDTGTYVCTTDGTGVECQLSGPTIEPGDLVEVCNGVDDDCDGEIDEDGVCDGCIGYELCDGKDNDCDGRFDEEITRPCGTDVGECEPGIEECLEVTSEQPSGTWLDCTGTLPQPEDCNGLDDNCDGVIDGLQRPCTTMPDPPGNPNIGVCHDGIQVCPPGSGPPKSWADFPCDFEVTPAASDWCNGLDDDCDTEIDEDFVSEECTLDCGTGTTACDSATGEIYCSGVADPQPEDCNGLDDDCNGLVDDGDLIDEPDDLDCYDGGLCLPGTLTCLGGDWVCVGGTPPGIEICDCEDNNCNDEIDEGDICAPGAICVECQCAYPCGEGEFPCPLGSACEHIEDVGDYCLVDLCYGVECVPDENGDKTECVDGECQRSCDLVTCPGGLVCRGSDGQCVPDNCLYFPDRCTEDQFCVAGECVDDPCANVTCTGDGEYCVDGQCVGTCAGVTCADGEHCVLGVCQPVPCGGQCGPHQTCNEATGTCVEDLCEGIYCGQDQVCDPLTGECVTDPCFGVTCPNPGEICENGTCYDPNQVFPPDAGVPDQYVTAGGGGGCAASRGNGSTVFVLILVALLALRRREEVC